MTLFVLDGDQCKALALRRMRRNESKDFETELQVVWIRLNPFFNQAAKYAFKIETDPFEGNLQFIFLMDI